MGKLVCKCGYVFDLTTAPEAHMWIAIKDADFESLRVAEFEAERLGVDYGKNKDMYQKSLLPIPQPLFP